jgi:hypothetical protein
MEYVVDADPDRFAGLGVQVFGIDPQNRSCGQLAQLAIAELRAFFTSIGAPINLSPYGIDAGALRQMAKLSVRFGPIGHLRALNEDDVYDILQRAL